MKKKLSAIFFAFLGILLVASTAYAKPRIIHAIVPLADNIYQGIALVPRDLGNGQDPQNNLYWGAQYGLRTVFNKDKNWVLLDQQTSPAQSFSDFLASFVTGSEKAVLERVIYRYKKSDVYLVAEAYDGRFIKTATEAFLLYAQGREKQTIKVKGMSFGIGGNADLLIYAGHNGLMDFSISGKIEPAEDQNPKRQVAVIASVSRAYFSTPLKMAGIAPALLTTQKISPEGYVVKALAESWAQRQKPETLRNNVATVYARYQGLDKPPLAMFVTEYAD